MHAADVRRAVAHYRVSTDRQGGGTASPTLSSRLSNLATPPPFGPDEGSQHRGTAPAHRLVVGAGCQGAARDGECQGLAALNATSCSPAQEGSGDATCTRGCGARGVRLLRRSDLNRSSGQMIRRMAGQAAPAASPPPHGPELPAETHPAPCARWRRSHVSPARWTRQARRTVAHAEEHETGLGEIAEKGRNDSLSNRRV